MRRTLLAIALFTSSVASARAQSEPRLLVHAVIESRQRIQSGRVTFTSVAQFKRDARSNRDDFTVAWDAGGFHARRRTNLPRVIGNKIPPGMPRIPDFSDADMMAKLRKAGAVFDADDVTDALVLPSAGYKYVRGNYLEVWDAEELRQRCPNPEAFDPRLLGIIPNLDDASIGRPLESVLNIEESQWTEPGPPGADGVRMIEGRWHVGKVLALNRLWIDPRKGFSIVRRELGRADSPKPGNVMTVRLRQWNNGVWFPDHIEQAIGYRGQYNTSVVIDVTSAEFNAPIPESEFTLAAMDLPRGESVRDHRTQREFARWNGQEIVKTPPASAPALAKSAPPEQLPVVEEKSDGAWLPWSLAGIAAVAAGVVWWRRRSLT